MAEVQSGALMRIYQELYAKYGPQGWWPLSDLRPKDKGSNDDSVKGYHPLDYDYPKTAGQAFEICIGAILTQNTSWKNVETAIANLIKINCTLPEKILALDAAALADAIKPSGYYNQKAKKLVIFAGFYNSLKGKTPSREELLGIWGIGKETADSMLLYAFKQPVFVVDAYTKRIFSELSMVGPDDEYDKIKNIFEKNLKPDLKVYQEFHALIVEHAKKSARAKKKV